jgi:transposase-like protein
MSRRKFSKEFKEAAVRRLELGASVTEVARAVEVIPNMLHRWRQEVRNHRVGAFSGYGKSRAPIEPRTQAVIFRLTEDELNQVKKACSEAGWRSIAEFARSQVLRATGEPSLLEVNKKLDELRVAVQQIRETLAKR